jgi:UDP-N-acetylmuramoyl-tripeptide--D-alanyl-D-alanine ligase
VIVLAPKPILTLVELAQFSGGDLLVRELAGGPAEREALLRGGVDGASIDSRTLAPGALFVPLPGSRTDGHAFIPAAFARGAAASLCARARLEDPEIRGVGPLVAVDDVTAALQQIARRYREAWSGLLVGVTGSAGKTTTKDLVAAVLATAAPVLKTEGNLNNHWGVPITLLRLRPEHRAAVIEMGMNHPGEIAQLAGIARPGAAVVTGAGSAHLEHMGSLEAIAREKASLAHRLGPHETAYVAADSPRLLEALAGARCRRVTYGLGSNADLHPRRVRNLGPAGSRVEVEGFPPIALRLVGRHQVPNALAALAVARELRLDPAAAARAIENCEPSRGRMEVRRARGALLLVDCYNANPESTRAALETLAEWPDASRRIAILGDMLELGPGAAGLHRETAAAARDTEVWAVGDHAADTARGARGAGAEATVFAGIPEVARALDGALEPGVVVLLKASRGARLERVLDGLAGLEGEA